VPSSDGIQSGVDWVTGVQAPDPAQQPIPGVANPYGPGASSYEPNTKLYTPGTDPLFAGSSLQLAGYDAVDKAQADGEATQAQAADNAAGGQTSTGVSVPGSAAGFVQAAKRLLGKPYVWGGTTINGTDCSGLLYYAFNAAGIKMPRYAASQYGHMGTQVDSKQALPGDIVYWDEPGSVDHVGIYLGNGMVLNSPHSGTVTQIQHVWGNPVYRRIINDDNFNAQVSPTGPVLGYGTGAAAQAFTPGADLTNPANVPYGGFTNVPNPYASVANSIGRSKAI
jgi:cell wall-associated NlpC family hydrolase